MARPRKAEDEKRVKLGIRMDPELLAWVDENSGYPGAPFKDRTHAIEVALARLRGEEKGTPARARRTATSEKR